MKELDNIVKEQALKIVEFLKDKLNKGFEGGYYNKMIYPTLGEELNKLGISYSQYTDGEFEEVKVWYRKGEVIAESKRD